MCNNVGSFKRNQKFNIITNHSELTSLFIIKGPGWRLTLWRLKLEEY